MPSVFISYSRKDQDVAESFEKVLKSHGLGVWRDQESIYAGEKWPKAIGNAIASNEMLLLLWSRQAKGSHFVEFEWNTALALQKAILPVFIEDVKLPPALSALNGIPADNLTRGITKIKERISNIEKVEGASQEEVIDVLEDIRATRPQEALREFKAAFKQKKWHVKGNVYQVSGGDIHINENASGSGASRNRIILGLLFLTLIAIVLVVIKSQFGSVSSSAGDTLQLTIYVHGPEDRQQVVLENTGTLFVDLDNDRRRAQIGESGRTNFGEIPVRFKGRNIGIGLEAPGYELISPRSGYFFEGKPIYLGVQRDDSLGKIKGIVKNRDGSIFIDSALVMVGNDTITRTNALGIFNITLPPRMQVKDEKTPYQLTVRKEGYLVSTEYYYPLSGDIEIRMSQ